MKLFRPLPGRSPPGPGSGINPTYYYQLLKVGPKYRTSPAFGYFDQQTGALHAIHWSKACFQHFNIFFWQNKEKGKQIQNK